MLTKEQILEKHYKNYQNRIAFDDQVLAAMEEYAQQQVKNCIKPAVMASAPILCMNCAHFSPINRGGKLVAIQGECSKKDTVVWKDENCDKFEHLP